MQMNNVQSSQFKRVGYDAATQKMRIDFGKSTYEYSNVAQKDYDAASARLEAAIEEGVRQPDGTRDLATLWRLSLNDRTHTRSALDCLRSWLYAADQHALGPVAPRGAEVEEPVHAVHQIDIDRSTFTVDQRLIVAAFELDVNQVE